MWTSEEDWNTMALIEGHHVLACLVWSVVLQDDQLASPAWILLIQLLDQSREVQLHHGRVGIRLYE